MVDAVVQSDSTEQSTSTKIPVGISSCLLGERVRFDSGHKQNAYIMQTLGNYFEYRPFCPEVSIGLGIPREPIRLVVEEDGVHCVGTRTPELDVTDALLQAADDQRQWHSELFGYIVKKDSPSCGMERVKLYKGEGAQRVGVGLYARRLMENFPNLPIEEEGRLGDAVLRENFIQRVLIFKRWHDQIDSETGWDKLTRFHAAHKLVLFSHNQAKARALGRDLADASTHYTVAQFRPRYLSQLMKILKIPASRKNHVNVLQHIQGYLKNTLDKDDKKELTDSISHYHQGLVPLIVPLTLLRHFFRKHPDPYIEEQHYLNPHPVELKLLNHL